MTGPELSRLALQRIADGDPPLGLVHLLLDDDGSICGLSEAIAPDTGQIGFICHYFTLESISQYKGATC